MAEEKVIWETNITPGMGYIQGPEGKKAHTQALQHDKEKIHRVIVNIVGKERQGKTSLRRMFTNEPFNEDERSTVGIEEDLVQTEGIIPKASWNKLDLCDANEQEFSTILSKHIKLRLKQGKSKIRSTLTPIVVFGKLLMVAHATMMVYFYALDCEALQGYPWVTGLFIAHFVICGSIFGTRDGFGIAIGILHFIIHCDTIYRRHLHETFDTVEKNTCFTFSLLTCGLMYFAVESVSSFLLGTSVGLGLLSAFCLRFPPENNIENGVYPLQDIHIHIMIITVTVAVATVRYERVLFYVMGPLVAICICLLPREYCYTLMGGVACGHTHTLFLGLGQKLYVYLNERVKRHIKSRMYRRYMCHVGGFIPGLVLADRLRWEPAEYIICHVFSVVILFATIECVNFLLGEKKTMNDPAKVLNVVETSPTLKLVVRDFAGHPLYHSAHHIYMTGQNVYIVVFDLVEAKKRFEETYQDVLYWLQSIIVHDSYPRVRVFIVGTHRDDDFLSSEDLRNASEKFKRNLPRQFYNVVVWNEDNNPTFFVENKVRNSKDPDHRKLKYRLSEIARQSETMKKKYPIKLFYFYNVIEQYRQQSQLVENVDAVFQVCRRNICEVKTFEEFEDLLNFYHQSGEIIFNRKDKRLKNILIFDPRAFVDFLSHIVTLPEFATRHQDYIDVYQHLSETGVCSKRLLEHIVSQKQWKTKLNFETVVALLESFDLMFEITFPTCASDGKMTPQYIIPALIPCELLNPDNYWETEESDSVFYICCEPSLPNSLFLRLIGQCATDKKSEPILEDGMWFLNISKTSALLTCGGDYAYKIELLDTNANHPHDVMRLIIRSRGYIEPLQLVNDVCGHVKRLVVRHFSKCRFKITLECPFPDPHECSRASRFHLLPLADMTQFENSTGVGIPQIKEFWCRGRKIRVVGGRIQEGTHPRCKESQELKGRKHHHDKLYASLTDLPHGVYSNICDLLNVESLLRRDWKTLAGKLGFTAGEVSVINARRDRDPTDALLQNWTSRDECATVGKLIEALRDMERQDVYTLLEDYA